MESLRKHLILLAVVIVCFFLQCTLLKDIALASVSPNLLIILTSAIGFIGGRREGIFIGFCCGILTDIFSGSTVGLYALIYVYIGYFNGCFRQYFYNEDVKLPLFLIAGSEFLYGLTVYAAFFLLRGKFQFPYYLMHIIIPELVYTVGITLLIYQPLMALIRWLNRMEKRSADKLV